MYGFVRLPSWAAARPVAAASAHWRGNTFPSEHLPFRTLARFAASMSRERAAVIPIPIVIADDHEIVRHGLVSLFKDTDIRVVGQAEDDDDAVKLARRLEPA
ncbi:MAG: DNA-binding response regulator, partial [Planctomycetia bacterium]|nr:DNA-binding response regulator [Planctomycetia bacterium]